MFASLLKSGVALATCNVMLCYQPRMIYDSIPNCFLTPSQEEMGCPNGIFYANKKGLSRLCGDAKEKPYLHTLGERFWIRRPGFKSWLHQQLAFSSFTCLDKLCKLWALVFKSVRQYFLQRGVMRDNGSNCSSYLQNECRFYSYWPYLLKSKNDFSLFPQHVSCLIVTVR